MALDESDEYDEIITDRDVTYVVNKTLLEQVKPISIDFVHTPRGSGFKVTSSLDATSGCGTSCSC
jgi:Fe-S cluster assembly iron-binding protein IscA